MCEAIPSPDLVLEVVTVRNLIQCYCLNFDLILISLTDPPAAISELYNNLYNNLWSGYILKCSKYYYEKYGIFEEYTYRPVDAHMISFLAAFP